MIRNDVTRTVPLITRALRRSTRARVRRAEEAHHSVPVLPHVGEEPEESVDTAVPRPLRVAAAFSWRLIVVAIAAAALTWTAMQLSVIIIPLAVALLFTALLHPFVSWLHASVRLPKAAAAAVGLLLALALVVSLLSQAASEILSEIPLLLSRATAGLYELLDWLHEGPLHLDAKVVDTMQTSITSDLTAWARTNSANLASGALSITSSFAAVLSGLLIMLFCLFFLLKDGRRIWVWVVRLFPVSAREPLHEAALRGWVCLGGYVRTQIKVAAIDAVGIGLGAAFLHVPMVVPIVVLVFFGSFIPIVGALVSGTVAVLVALMDQGLTTAALMLVIILAVQQIEGNLLHPWLMSRAVSLHPLAVLLVVVGAGSVAGIPGALFGVPIAAFINAALLYLHGYDPVPELAQDGARPGGAPGTLALEVAQSYRQVKVIDPELVELPEEALATPADEETPTGQERADEGRDPASELPARTSGPAAPDAAEGEEPAR